MIVLEDYTLDTLINDEEQSKPVILLFSTTLPCLKK